MNRKKEAVCFLTAPCAQVPKLLFLYDHRIYDERYQRPCRYDHDHIPLPGIFHCYMTAVKEEWCCRRRRRHQGRKLAIIQIITVRPRCGKTRCHHNRNRQIIIQHHADRVGNKVGQRDKNKTQQRNERKHGHGRYHGAENIGQPDRNSCICAADCISQYCHTPDKCNRCNAGSAGCTPKSRNRLPFYMDDTEQRQRNNHRRGRSPRIIKRLNCRRQNIRKHCRITQYKMTIINSASVTFPSA